MFTFAIREWAYLHYTTKVADKVPVFVLLFLKTYLLAENVKTEINREKLNLLYLAGRYGFEHKVDRRAWSDAIVKSRVYFELKKICGFSALK